VSLRAAPGKSVKTGGILLQNVSANPYPYITVNYFDNIRPSVFMKLLFKPGYHKFSLLHQAYFSRIKAKEIKVTLDQFVLRKEFFILGRHIITVNKHSLQDMIVGRGCGECQTSCQSACKTSLTVGNQSCCQLKNQEAKKKGR
jgi:predicted ribosomally synthesized six-cysteine peptide SCIFF